MPSACDERSAEIAAMTFPPMPNGFIWVRWLVADIEARAIELLTTATTPALEAARAQALDKMKRDFCHLEGLVQNASAKNQGDVCPWCNGGICNPDC
jgi:phosphatidylethanolamine-binding protein (PEBP) family uncharacterized protein